MYIVWSCDHLCQIFHFLQTEAGMISEKILVFDQKNEIIVRQNQNSHLKSYHL